MADTLPPVTVGVPLLDALLAALAAAPADDLPRLALADYLDETGDARATLARLAIVDAEHVAQVLWPKSKVVYVSHGGFPPDNYSRYVHNKHGGYLCNARLIEDHITGRCLLVDPNILWAVRVARAKVVLDLFREGKEWGNGD